MSAALTEDLPVLSSDQITEYHQRGYLLIEGVVTDRWLTRLRAGWAAGTQIGGGD